jgi:hypothetical protein
MAVDTFTFTMGILSIIGSLIAAYLSYIIYKYNRLSKAWLAVTVAFVLIIFRRGIGFISDFELLPEWRFFLKTTESILLVVISLLYIWGFWSMKKNFESFEVVEKKVKDKINLLGKKDKKSNATREN